MSLTEECPNFRCDPLWGFGWTAVTDSVELDEPAVRSTS